MSHQEAVTRGGGGGGSSSAELTMACTGAHLRCLLAAAGPGREPGAHAQAPRLLSVGVLFRPLLVAVVHGSRCCAADPAAEQDLTCASVMHDGRGLGGVRQAHPHPMTPTHPVLDVFLLSLLPSSERPCLLPCPPNCTKLHCALGRGPPQAELFTQHPPTVEASCARAAAWSIPHLDGPSERAIKLFRGQQESGRPGAHEVSRRRCWCYIVSVVAASACAHPDSSCGAPAPTVNNPGHSRKRPTNATAAH
jgi:hypothetical protein